MLWTAVFLPLLTLMAVGLIVFYYSRFGLNLSFFLRALVPIVLLGIVACIEYIDAKAFSMENYGSLQYRILVVVEEMAELFAATFFVHTHYSYGIWRWEKDSLSIELKP